MELSPSSRAHTPRRYSFSNGGDLLQIIVGLCHLFGCYVVLGAAPPKHRINVHFERLNRTFFSSALLCPFKISGITPFQHLSNSA